MLIQSYIVLLLVYTFTKRELLKVVGFHLHVVCHVVSHHKLNYFFFF